MNKTRLGSIFPLRTSGTVDSALSYMHLELHPEPKQSSNENE